ncbi:MAG: hypothetical protein IAG10_19090, partial [Planctomycetaceae bacterium]|nr:hypothetical protein [Planctomycetaceae bacterium]
SAAGKVAAPDELARICESIAVETRTQFSGGVRELVAVTPLLSKNLKREFDHLQTGYAALLGRAISQAPGVAVVEIDEARAIRQELAVTGDGIKDRLVPLFVEGEFVMSGRLPDVRVRMALRITDGKTEHRKLERAEMTLAQSAEWLTNDVSRAIAASQSEPMNGARFTREQQFDQLARRADLFSRAAAFEESSALREAALLLDDDDIEQRMSLIADLRRLLVEATQKAQELRQSTYLKSSGKFRAAWAVTLDDKQRQPLFEPARQRMQRIDELFRWLLTRRAISRREATWYARELVQDWINVRGLARDEDKAEFREAADQMMWTMINAFEQLDAKLRMTTAHPAFERTILVGHGNAGDDQRQHDILCQIVAEHWLRDLLGGSDRLSGVGYESWQRFVLQHASRKWPSLNLFGSLFLVSKVPADEHEVRKRYQDFVAELEQAPEPLFRLYARSGRLALKMSQPRELWDATMVREAIALQSEWDNFLKSDPAFSGASFHLRRSVEAKRQEIERATRAAGPKRHGLSPNLLIGIDPFPRIAFEPLTDVPTEWQHWRQINDTLDVMWSFNGVWTMSEPGRAKRIFEWQSRSDVVLDVCCDGRLIWVFAQDSGLRAYTLSGQLVGVVFPDDESQPLGSKGQPEIALPPVGIAATQRQMALKNSGASVRLFGPTHLHPIAPGRCLVIGTYQPKQRLWIAAVSVDEDSDKKSSLRVRVVHEATTDAQRSVIGDDGNPAESFAPRWLTEIQSPSDPARRLLLIGRPEFFASQLRSGRRPLAVDLDSLDVTVFPSRFGMFSEPEGERRYFHSGRLVFTSQASLNLLSPRQDNSQADWTRTELLPFNLPLDQRVWWRMPSRKFVSVGDHLENPAPLWRRVFPAEGRLEQVTPEPVPLRYRFGNYAVSAHFGLVAWHSGDIAYRVTFDRDPDLPRDLAWRYPFVPKLEHERHDRAVQAIRQQGGFVDSVWLGVPTSFTLKPEGWMTKVYLSDAWRGGDEGLNALADLHQIRELRLVKAPITNVGLETISRLTSLRTLSLEETNVTDEGLPPLASLKELTNLRLECASGIPLITDTGLALITQFPRLSRLTIAGPGFT